MTTNNYFELKLIRNFLPITCVTLIFYFEMLKCHNNDSIFWLVQQLCTHQHLQLNHFLCKRKYQIKSSAHKCEIEKIEKNKRPFKNLLKMNNKKPFHRQFTLLIEFFFHHHSGINANLKLSINVIIYSLH